MKILLDYDTSTDMLTGPAGLAYFFSGLEAAEFKQEDNASSTIELIKLGIAPDDIIKLKHQGLL